MDLQEFADATLQRISEKWDAVIAITGKEGVGKTTLALRLAWAMDKNFDLDKNVLYNPESKTLIDKIFHLPIGSVILIDEAIKTMYKRKFATEVNTTLNQVYAICRKQQKISLLCMPRFFDFDEYFRNHRIRFWIHVYSRGKAVVFISDDDNPFSEDPWHLKENTKKIGKRLRSRWHSSDDSVLDAYASAGNTFFTSLKFDALPDEVEQAYKQRVEKLGVSIIDSLYQKALDKQDAQEKREARQSKQLFEQDEVG